MKQTYAELLKSPEWQKRRLEILSRDKFTCQNCASTTTHLHVHHRLYIRGASPWQYVDGALVTLCEDCHARWHELQAKIESLFCELTATEFLDIRTDATLEELGEHIRAIAHRNQKTKQWQDGYAKGYDKAEEVYRLSLCNTEPPK